MLIDLTMTIEDNAPAYPGDAATQFLTDHTIESFGYTTTKLTLSSHLGTHIDSPSHIIEGGPSISDMDISRFIGHAVILDVRGDHVIEYFPNYSDAIDTDDIVILYTGASENKIDTYYFKRYVQLTPDLIDFFIDTKIKMLGIDCASIEAFGQTDVHERFLEANIPILENLVNISSVPDGYSYEIFALPMKLKCDGAPARVILRTVEG